MIQFAVFVLAATSFVSLAGAGTNFAVELRRVATLPPTSLNQFIPTGAAPFDLAAAQSNGLNSTSSPSVGSGLARDQNGTLFGITDRGPNALVMTGSDGRERRVLPLPEFAPGIVRLNLRGDSLAIREFIPLRNRNGKPLTGLANEASEEPCYNSANAATPLSPDPGGVDPEGIRCLPDGKFLLSEEYSPSLLVVATNGEVLMRYTPVSKPLPGAGYPVKNILPDAITRRRPNRGFECLALSADGRTAYAILQSALGDAEDARYAGCRVHRVLELDVSDPLAARVTGMFLLPASRAGELRGTKNQNQVKLNDAEWLGPRRLLVLEQDKAAARLRVADLSRATNLLGRPDADALVYEDVHTDIIARQINTASVTTLLELDSLPAIDSKKLEGLAILADDEIALANDNDFGIGENKSGEPSRIWVVRVPGHPFADAVAK